MSAATIRLAKASDAPGIAEVQVASWRSTYGDIVPAAHFDTFTVAFRTRRWEEILASSPSTTIVALVDHRVVGFCSGVANVPGSTHDSEMLSLYVHDDFHKTGVGRALFAWMVEYLMECEHQSMEVWTFPANPACGFYRHMGGTDLNAERSIDIAGETLPLCGFGYPDLTALVASLTSDEA